MPLTTGFSGTNDNKALLPRSIEQQEIAGLKHTNAMVMSYLLRAENRTYVCAEDTNSQRLSVSSLLDLIVSQAPATNVLIDVGAQVLDMANKEVAQEWLKTDLTAAAALYFDEADEAVVISRDGRTELLSSSRYQDNLDDCVIYMDEVHTRGTDVKLPPSARAAVTLGPRVSKDRFVQVS